MVLLSLASCLEMVVSRNCGLEREPGGSVSALSMTLVHERNGSPHEWNEKSM